MRMRTQNRRKPNKMAAGSFVDIHNYEYINNIRVRNEKIDIDEINWTPNQHKEYHNLYIKTAKRAATGP